MPPLELGSVMTSTLSSKFLKAWVVWPRVTKAPSSIFQVLVLSMELFQPVKVLPSKMVVKPSSVSAAGDRLTAPTRRMATRERTDFMVRPSFYAAFSPYSRFLNWPGCGFGYRPLASGIKGDGPSAVSLSVLGEYSWSWLRASSKEISWPVWALRRPILQTTLASTPRLTSLWGLSLRMASRRAIHSFL